MIECLPQYAQSPGSIPSSALIRYAGSCMLSQHSVLRIWRQEDQKLKVVLSIKQVQGLPRTHDTRRTNNSFTMLLIISYIFNRFSRKKGNYNITYIHLCFNTPKCRKTYVSKSRNNGFVEQRRRWSKWNPFAKDTTFKHSCLSPAAKFCQEKDTDFLLRLIYRAHLGRNKYCWGERSQSKELQLLWCF